VDVLHGGKHGEGDEQQDERKDEQEAYHDESLTIAGHAGVLGATRVPLSPNPPQRVATITERTSMTNEAQVALVAANTVRGFLAHREHVRRRIRAPEPG
jgi:hypothetical protein